jgi:hypothetical protein
MEKTALMNKHDLAVVGDACCFYYEGACLNSRQGLPILNYEFCGSPHSLQASVR